MITECAISAIPDQAAVFLLPLSAPGLEPRTCLLRYCWRRTVAPQPGRLEIVCRLGIESIQSMCCLPDEDSFVRWAVAPGRLFLLVVRGKERMGWVMLQPFSATTCLFTLCPWLDSCGRDLPVIAMMVARQIFLHHLAPDVLLGWVARENVLAQRMYRAMGATVGEQILGIFPATKRLSGDACPAYLSRSSVRKSLQEGAP